MDTKVAKRCLKEVMEMIKVLLVASFCSNSTNQDVALSLQRKMSSCSGAGQEDVAMESSQQKSQGITASAANQPQGSGDDKKAKSKMKEEQENMQE